MFIAVAHAFDAAAFGRAIDPIISTIVNPLILLAFFVALIVFVYGIFQMVWSEGDDARQNGKLSIVSGLIGMFIMTSAWGIIYIISNTVKDIGR